MSATDLLENLISQGVIIRLMGDDLEWEARKGVMTPDVIQSLRDHKAEVMALLRGALPVPDTPFIDSASQGNSTPEGRIKLSEGQVSAIPDQLRIVQLVNSKNGCWKILEDGKKVEISDVKWREELKWLFKGQMSRSIN